MCLAAVSLIGAVVQGIGAKASSDREAANLTAQANAKRRQASITQTTGAYQAQRKQEEVDRTLGQNRAAYSGSGVALSGTPADVIAENAVEGALDVAAIRWNSGMEATTQRYNASVDDVSAKATKKAGNLAFITPIIGGVAKFGSDFGGFK